MRESGKPADTALDDFGETNATVDVIGSNGSKSTTLICTLPTSEAAAAYVGKVTETVTVPLL